MSARGAASRRSTREARARALVLEVAARHFDEAPRDAKELRGGLTNDVWRFRVRAGDFIVRSHPEPDKLDHYAKERWAMRQARAVRVPTPRAVAVDRVADGRPYILVEHVAGVPGTHAADRNALLQALGRVAARLHGVRTHGIGHVFDWAPAERTRATSMAEWIDGHYRATDRIALLRRHGVIDAAQARALAATAATLRRWRRPPVLQHGDLRLKNVMVDATTGRLAALLDWDDARSMPGPHWDLSIALHDLGIDGKEAFLHGYGLTPRAYAALLPGIRLFNVLNYAHALRSAMRHRDARRLAWLRVRCSGALDLYRP